MAHAGQPGDHASLIFCDKVTSLVDEGKAADIVYLDFSKATVSHSILLGKLAVCFHLIPLLWNPGFQDFTSGEHLLHNLLQGWRSLSCQERS